MPRVQVACRGAGIWTGWQLGPLEMRDGGGDRKASQRPNSWGPRSASLSGAILGPPQWSTSRQLITLKMLNANYVKSAGKSEGSRLGSLGSPASSHEEETLRAMLGNSNKKRVLLSDAHLSGSSLRTRAQHPSHPHQGCSKATTPSFYR